jgi:hypothetical protein
VENNQFKIQDIITISEEMTLNNNSAQDNAAMSVPCAAYHEENE